MTILIWIVTLKESFTQYRQKSIMFLLDFWKVIYTNIIFLFINNNAAFLVYGPYYKYGI